MKNRILLTVVLFTVMGCDRLKLDEQTKIQIQLPGVQSSLSSKVDMVSTSSSSSPVPTGFTGDKPINCYLIAAGGPEEPLQRNVCSRKDGTTTFTPRRIGPWIGAAPAGTAIGIDVPSGKDRVIYVVGFHAVNATACRDFRTGFPSDSEISDPYLVGEKGGLLLNPGEVMDLPLEVSFNLENRFDGCDGPDFPEHGGGESVPTLLKVTKEWFPYNKFTTNNCQSFDVVLTDNEGRHASFATAVTFTPQVLENSTPLQIYNSYEDCNASMYPMSSLTIPPMTDRKQVVFKTGDVESPFSLNIGNISAPGVLTVVGAGAGYQSHSPYMDTVDLEGPWSILPDICYPFTVKLKEMSGYALTAPAAMTVNLSASGVSFYSDASCSTTTSSVAFPVSSGAQTVYAKMTGTTPNSLVTLTSSGYISSQRMIYRGYGLNIPSALEIRGYNQMYGINNGCSNEGHEVYLVNQYHTPVLASAAMAINLSTTSGLSAFANSADCAAGTPLASTVSLAAGAYSSSFFVKSIAYGMQNISASSGTFTANYSVKIDGPYQIGLMLPGGNSFANNACFPLEAKILNYSGSVSQNVSGAYLSATVTGVSSPYYYLYSEPTCTTTLSSVDIPYSGPSVKQFYMKVNNITGSPLNISIGLSGGSFQSSPTQPITIAP